MKWNVLYFASAYYSNLYSIVNFTFSCRFRCHLLLWMSYNFCVFSSHQSITSKIHDDIFHMSEISRKKKKKNSMFKTERLFSSSLTIWLQPPFFSINDLHFGHPFVYFVMYKTVSSLLSFSHFSIKLHEIGSWKSAPQLKQKLKPHTHVHFCW